MRRQSESFVLRFFNSHVFLFALIAIAIMVMFSYGRAYYLDYQVRQEIEKMKQNAEVLETKKSQLLEALRHVQSSSFVEEKARTDLGMSKIGEKVMVIQTSSTPFIGNGQTKSAVVQFNGVSNYRKWWRLFMEK